MSICSGSVRLPIFNISATNPASAFTSRKPSATSAPACANANEIARPNPRAAPVTSATCPFNVNCGYSITLLRRLSFIPTHRLIERPSIRDSMVPPSHINPQCFQGEMKLFSRAIPPRNTTMMGRPRDGVLLIAHLLLKGESAKLRVNKMRTVPLRIPVRAFILEILRRDAIAHTMDQTRGISVLDLALFLFQQRSNSKPSGQWIDAPGQRRILSRLDAWHALRRKHQR